MRIFTILFIVIYKISEIKTPRAKCINALESLLNNKYPITTISWIIPTSSAPRESDNANAINDKTRTTAAIKFHNLDQLER